MESNLTISQESYNLTPVGQSTKQFELIQRMAQAFSSSTIVPQQYKENFGNCVIAMDMALRMNASPLMLMQNLYIVHNQPTFSSKFLIATINASGRFASLRYEYRGKQGDKHWGCRAYTYEISDKDHKDPIYGAWVDMAMAEAEGWTKKAGSKWLTMPELMLQYRASAFWQRTYAPELSMGFMTTEEAQDIQDVNYTEVKDDKIETLKQETVSMPIPPSENDSPNNNTQHDPQASAESAPF